jgi:hypothetical protein
MVEYYIGLRKDEIPKLFESFLGIHVEGIKDGAGLGLSISKELLSFGKRIRWSRTCRGYVSFNL